MEHESTLAFQLLSQFNSYRSRIEQFAAVAKYCPIPVVITAHDGTTIFFINQAYMDLTGFKDVSEMQDRGWLPRIHPEDQERILAEWTVATSQSRDLCSTFRFKVGDDTREVRMQAFKVAGNGYVVYFLPADCMICQRQACINASTSK